MNYEQLVTEYFTNRILHTVQKLPGQVFLGKQAVKSTVNQELLRARLRTLINKKFLNSGIVEIPLYSSE